MLILLALPVVVAVAAMHRYLQRFAPTNLLIRRVRARKPRWRDVGLLLAISAALLIAMRVLADAAVSGAPGWLNLFVLVLAWDAIKFGTLAMLQAQRCLVRGSSHGRRGRTDVRRRAVPMDGPSALRLCS